MKAQRVIMATRADLPMPWPEAVASWMASEGVSKPRRIFSRISLCQANGPSNSAKAPSSDQGNAPRTNAKGSSLTEASQAMSLGSKVCVQYAKTDDDGEKDGNQPRSPPRAGGSLEIEWLYQANTSTITHQRPSLGDDSTSDDVGRWGTPERQGAWLTLRGLRLWDRLCLNRGLLRG